MVGNSRRDACCRYCEFMRLLPGDVILTGTTRGVAYNKSNPDYLRAGDLLRWD
ncbi:MAG: fumarylacetoacetate hydrolase family protein [Afipia sp.]